MAKGLAFVVALLLAACSQVAADPPDWKKEHFTVIETSPAGGVAMSDVHQESKDVRSVYLLIVFSQPDDDGTTALLGKIEFNCLLGQAQYDEAARLDANAAVIGRRPPHSPGFQQVIPGSGTADLFLLVCGHKASMPREARHD